MEKTKADIWVELGKELKIVRVLLLRMICDPEYQSILTKKDMSNVVAAERRLSNAKNVCEIAMLAKGRKNGLLLSKICELLPSKDWSHVFYNDEISRTDEKVEQIRKICKS